MKRQLGHQNWASVVDHPIILNEMDSENTAKETRVWVDGCFDIFHYGHANAIRQSRDFGTILVAGVHADADIELNKGPTVLPQVDRLALVRACRWVDAVIPDAPYVTSISFVRQYNIDYVSHGDDVTTDAGGLDTYRFIKEAGMYRECKRTEGVSTTDAISRVLFGKRRAVPDIEAIDEALLKAFATDPQYIDAATVLHVNPSQGGIDSAAASSPPLPRTSYTLAMVAPTVETDAVRYVDGPWDLFSAEDVAFLEKMSEKGTKKVVVGVWASKDIESVTGDEPILSFQERVLGVLQCRHVHAVVAPAAPHTTIPVFFPRVASLTYASRPNSSTLAVDRIKARRKDFEARQIRKEGKAAVEAALKGRTEKEVRREGAE